MLNLEKRKSCSCVFEQIENEKDGVYKFHKMVLVIFNNSLFLGSTYSTHFKKLNHRMHFKKLNNNMSV